MNDFFVWGPPDITTRPMNATQWYDETQVRKILKPDEMHDRSAQLQDVDLALSRLGRNHAAYARSCTAYTNALSQYSSRRNDPDCMNLMQRHDTQLFDAFEKLVDTYDNFVARWNDWRPKIVGSLKGLKAIKNLKKNKDDLGQELNAISQSLAQRPPVPSADTRQVANPAAEAWAMRTTPARSVDAPESSQMGLTLQRPNRAAGQFASGDGGTALPPSSPPLSPPVTALPQYSVFDPHLETSQHTQQQSSSSAQPQHRAGRNSPSGNGQGPSNNTPGASVANTTNRSRGPKI